MPFPHKDTRFATGGNLAGIPTVCGGLYHSNGEWNRLSQCYQLLKGRWRQTVSLNTARNGAAALEVGYNLILTGGWDQSASPISSSEIITKVGKVMNGPDMRQSIGGHCMVLLNNEIFVLGGFRIGESKATYVHDSNFNYLRDAPGLKEYRFHFVCGGYEDKIIAAGPGSSAEVFDTKSSTWTLCKWLFKSFLVGL